MAFSDAGTKIGHLSPWETFKSFALHNALQTIEGKLQTRACDLLGERVGLKERHRHHQARTRAHAQPNRDCPHLQPSEKPSPSKLKPGRGGRGGLLQTPVQTLCKPLQTLTISLQTLWVAVFGSSKIIAKHKPRGHSGFPRCPTEQPFYNSK